MDTHHHILRTSTLVRMSNLTCLDIFLSLMSLCVCVCPLSGKRTYNIPSDQEQIMTELYKNGPVEAAFDVYEDFLLYKSGETLHRTCIVLWMLNLCKPISCLYVATEKTLISCWPLCYCIRCVSACDRADAGWSCHQTPGLGRGEWDTILAGCKLLEQWLGRQRYDLAIRQRHCLTHPYQVLFETI